MLTRMSFLYTYRQSILFNYYICGRIIPLYNGQIIIINEKGIGFILFPNGTTKRNSNKAL